MSLKTALAWNKAQKGQNYTSLFASIGIFLFAAFMLLLVFIFRAPSALLPGRESYFLLRIAQGIGISDALSFGGRFASYPMGMPFILHFLPSMLAMLLPFLLGMLSLLLFSLLLKDFEVKPKKLALLALIASPAFIYTFNTLNTVSAGMFLSLLGFWLFSRKSIVKYISIPVFAIISLFDPAIAFIAMAMLFFFAFFQQKEKKLLFLLGFLLSLAAAAAYYGIIIGNAGFERILFDAGGFGINNALRAFLSDFGAWYGIGLFALILAVFGIISKWDLKYRVKFVFFSFLLLAIMLFFTSRAAVVLNLFIAVFAAYGFVSIYEAKWESRLFQRFVLLIFACGLLFSTLSFSERLVLSEPSADIVNGMNALKELPDGVVFSDYTRGFWISFAGKQNVMDENMVFAPGVNRRWQDSQLLFHTRDIKKAGEIINKYNIKYIWIDAEMKNNIWNDPEDGLLFLLKYNKGMKKVYNKKGVEIWEVLLKND